MSINVMILQCESDTYIMIKANQKGGAHSEIKNGYRMVLKLSVMGPKCT